jgi:CRISPR/Cas system endoribonuclease Cas6 (RAMP superfamily)
VGSLRLQAHQLPPCDCAALDLLAAYAFYCGSGHKTTQGLGQTRVL